MATEAGTVPEVTSLVGWLVGWDGFVRMERERYMDVRVCMNFKKGAGGERWWETYR